MKKLLFVFVFLLLLPASAKAAAVEIEPRRAGIDLGESTLMLLRASGEEDLRIQLQSSPFPYLGFENEGGERLLGTSSVRVRPSRNTRYRALLLRGEEVVAQSASKMVWVRPLSKTVFRGNSARGWTEMDIYYWTPYLSLPLRQRKIYLYTRCRRGDWRLRGKGDLAWSALSGRFRIEWKITRKISCSGTLQRWPVGMLLFPYMTASGDDGLGRPRLSREDAIKAASLLGRASIAPGVMQSFWGS